MRFPEGEVSDASLYSSGGVFTVQYILKDVDSVLYLDTDVILLDQIESIWSFYTQFNSSQIAAISIESLDRATSWYGRFARIPYYPPLGVNSGVILMNLTRMRSVLWVDRITEYYKEYKSNLTWDDQDLINIYFHYFPEQLYVFDCHWNYRTDHCMYKSLCLPAEIEGVRLLHGSRRVMHNAKQPVFKAIYTTFREHNLNDGPMKLLESLKNKITEINDRSNCGKLESVYWKNVKNVAHNMYQDGDSNSDILTDTIM